MWEGKKNYDEHSQIKSFFSYIFYIMWKKKLWRDYKYRLLGSYLIFPATEFNSKETIVHSGAASNAFHVELANFLCAWGH